MSLLKRKLSKDYPTDLRAWKELADHFTDVGKHMKLSDLFSNDTDRFSSCSLEANGIFLDFSKNLVSQDTLSLLFDLADQASVPEFVDAMFSGEKLNNTEDRAVLHTALRGVRDNSILSKVSGVDEIPEVLQKMFHFVDKVWQGEITGVTGRQFKNIVNIGIGGSDLGTVMAGNALRHHWNENMCLYSVSNIDGTQLNDLLNVIDLEETLFVVCSKTFTTLETTTNAMLARNYVEQSLGEEAISKHFVACSVNNDAMDEFGINSDYRFSFWDWVGGRFSICSAVGLSLALVIGYEKFCDLLDGAAEIDQHFKDAPISKNMPIIMALIGIWYNNFFGAESHVILPYDNRLDRFPAYLQQLQMESSGKCIRRDGHPVQVTTGMVIWGEPGSNAQHSFYQLLHQGKRLVPIDFLIVKDSSGGSCDQKQLAIANCLAQAEVLMNGFGSVEDKHYYLPGNRPSNILLFESLTPKTLGKLVALYEHKVFVENVIWGVNAFDQFGVELGKRMADEMISIIRGNSSYKGKVGSTSELLKRIVNKN